MKLLLKICAVISIIACVLWFIPVQKSGKIESQAYEKAAQLIGVKGNGNVPKVVYLSDQAFKRKFCVHPCTTASIYDDKEDRIYVRKSLNVEKPEGFSYLVHEMVHHFQRQEIKKGFTGQRCVSLEIEAYSAQAKYLSSQGRKLSNVNMEVLESRCG